MHAPHIEPIRPVATAALRRLAMVILSIVLIFGIYPAVLAIQAASR